MLKPPSELPVPIAQRRAHNYQHHGVELNDPYHWLRDPKFPVVDDPEVLAYLNAENAYFDAAMAPYAQAQAELFEELKARQAEDDTGVPYDDGDYSYQWRFTAGEQYRSWWRWPKGATDSATLFLSEPDLAKDCDYFSLGTLVVSPCGRYLAYSCDREGSERYQLAVRDLATGLDTPSRIDNVGGGVVWSADSQYLFYSVLSEQWRPYLIRRHCLADAAANTPTSDADIYQEFDDSFFVGVSITQSEEFIVISSGDHISSELRLLPSSQPLAAPMLVAARSAGVEYDLDHQGDYFYLLTNDTQKNFRLARTPISNPAPEHWQTIISGSDTLYLTGLVCFKDFIVLEERVNGLDQIRVIATEEGTLGETHHIDFPESTYSAGLGTNAEYAINSLRISYSSLITPSTTFDYPLQERQLITRKVQKIPSGYDAGAYRCERRLVTARDGTQVPVSLVWHKATPLNGTSNVHLYAYGAYGHAVAPRFSGARLSLLNRGFVYAIAHIRGGDDLGYHWYEAGKLAQRENTFNDFVDVAQGLVDSGLSSPGRLSISGGSAGGELMGAAVNQAPHLWGAVVAHVPFVDVLNTMLDASLPLTPMEWPEWGNPIEDPAAFNLLLGYSPYDQLKPAEYPPMLVTAGLADPRVTYWEPAKYVAKLRGLKTDENILLLKTNMSAGHGGKSGRFDSLQELAEEFLFILLAMTGEDPPPQGN